ncbi:MAG: patatin-like phospholipase family protein [Oligoflexales bacterium]|nr:patatin-like phospholipase family protein [Oligoflexales bacterium]
MRYYLLLVASPSQINKAKANLYRLEAEPINDRSFAECFRIEHPSLGALELRLHLLSQLDAVTPHLRQHPVDLLIYDEREGGVDAVEAFAAIKEDVDSLAQLWGPDFHFPLSRAVAILDGGENAAHKTFLLGREHVRDVQVAPRSLAQSLRWITKILTQDHARNEYKVGCAMSGGGMEGFLYQTGCCYALERALSGRSLNECDVYSGISSGSIVSSALAARVPLEEMIKAFLGKSETLPQIKGSILYDVAFAEISRRFMKQTLSWGGSDPHKWAQKAIRSVPTGFFKGDKLKKFIHDTLASYGCDDQFATLENKLFIGATNQDTFEHTVFGTGQWDQVDISEAVRASCSLPPFFTPCKIQNHHFIDGLITRTCNLELVVKNGCNLIFIIDPMRPYASWEPGEVDKKGGVYTLIQTIKTLVNSRFQLALDHITAKYHNVDFLIFQPYEECAKAMAGSPMKYKIRTNLVELAYKGTLQRLRERHSVYLVKLAKYGFELASQRQLLELERIGLEF